MTQPFRQITIIGLGLIGGSIAKCLKQSDPSILIASIPYKDQSPKCIDRVFSSLQEVLEWSDLIILATPLSSILPIAHQIKCLKIPPFNKKTIAIDVGSVKGKICADFERLTDPHIEFVSTHPMAGKEQWGFESSDPSLFQEASWIITPHAKNQMSTIESVSTFIEALGGKSTILTPEDHDRQTALISHFPAVLSRALLAFVEEKDPQALRIAGPGFKSMTRLAKDNPQLYEEIASFNADHLHQLMNEWIDFLTKNKDKYERLP